MAWPLRRTLPDGTLTQGDTFTLPLKGDPSGAITVHIAGPAIASQTQTADVTGHATFSFDTAAWPVGEYLWEATQSLSGVTSRLYRERIRIVASVASLAAGSDIRTKAEIAVAMLEASLGGSDSAEVQQYKINNRELRRYPVPERIALLAFWRREMQRERRVAAGKSTLGARIQAVF